MSNTYMEYKSAFEQYAGMMGLEDKSNNRFEGESLVSRKYKQNTSGISDIYIMSWVDGDRSDPIITGIIKIEFTYMFSDAGLPAVSDSFIREFTEEWKNNDANVGHVFLNEIPEKITVQYKINPHDLTSVKEGYFSMPVIFAKEFYDEIYTIANELIDDISNSIVDALQD